MENQTETPAQYGKIRKEGDEDIKAPASISFPRQEMSTVVLESPETVIRAAQEQAKKLMDVVENLKLYQIIAGKKFLHVEGWQLLAAFTGMTARIEWTKPHGGQDSLSWEARATVIDQNGEIVAAGEAMCSTAEANWRTKPEFQIRSMAQTRAISKALRTKLGFIAKMAGYEATPTEEIEPEPTESLKKDGKPKSHERPSVPLDPLSQRSRLEFPPSFSPIGESKAEACWAKGIEFCGIEAATEIMRMLSLKEPISGKWTYQQAQEFLKACKKRGEKMEVTALYGGSNEDEEVIETAADATAKGQRQKKDEH